MKNSSSTQKLITTAVFAALTMIATSVIKIQTPTFGYIHIGEVFVLMSGFFLGPVYGGLAAGLGSALADFLGGYVIWVPFTFLIKYMTAAVGGFLYKKFEEPGNKQKNRKIQYKRFPVIAAGIIAEAVMAAGYFAANIIMICGAGEGFSNASVISAASISLSELPFNAVQGLAGIVLAVILFPVFEHIRTITSNPQ